MYCWTLFLFYPNQHLSQGVEVVFSVSLAGDTKFYNVTENYTVNNQLMTIGDNLIHINEFTAKGETATFDFYYGENLGPFVWNYFQQYLCIRIMLLMLKPTELFPRKIWVSGKSKRRKLPSNEIPE